MTVGRAEHIHGLAQACTSLPVSTDVAPQLDRILAAATDLLDTDRGTIHLARPLDGALKIAVHVGFSPSSIEPLVSLDAGALPWRAAFEDGVRMAIDDVATDARLPDLRAEILRLGIRSFVSLPLAGQQGRPSGLLSIYRRRAHRLSKRALELLDICRLQAEQAIESKRSQETLKRNEAGLRLALEAGKMGNFEWNIHTNEIHWSDNLEAIHGLPAGTFTGTFESFQSLIHRDDRQGVLESIQRTVDTGADYEAEFRSATPDGSTHWILGKGRVHREQGRPLRMVGICMDITSRKRTEEALRESDRRKDEFLAMISHELRNPLFAITNASAVLESLATPDPISAKARGMIRRQTERLTCIVNDLLDVERLAAGKLVLNPVQLDLGELVEKCVARLASGHVLDRHVYEVRAARALVHGDGARLEQILTNLLTNAVKYTPAGGMVSIDVEADVQTIGGQAVLRVRDTGVGIARDLLPRIFELFVQSERGLDRRDGGVGVGLAIVRLLVGAHGGSVEAHSDGADHGTEIVIRLPLVQVAAATAKATAAAEPATARRRILVVDDNTDARQALVVLLELAGHELHEAADGLSGLASASSLLPDIVLADIGLPGIDGFEMARRIRARHAGPRLIALTGYDHPEQRRRGAEAGFDAYLIKPIEIEVLLRELPGA
jgi:PAS domain S-box-containing protein